ncbi:unnamed protein product [Linum trigynum]|uniref:Uncharacterized protein n=1 Tax=Linum trigynum TaxID=586398 RepID=A0AAV2DIH8_9ROSI
MEATDHGIRPRLFSTDNEVYSSYFPGMISPLSTDLVQFVFGWHFRNFCVMKCHFLWILKATDHGFGLRLFFNDD